MNERNEQARPRVRVGTIWTRPGAGVFRDTELWCLLIIGAMLVLFS